VTGMELLNRAIRVWAHDLICNRSRMPADVENWLSAIVEQHRGLDATIPARLTREEWALSDALGHMMAAECQSKEADGQSMEAMIRDGVPAGVDYCGMADANVRAGLKICAGWGR